MSYDDDDDNDNDMLSVADLIALLRRCPQDAKVIIGTEYLCCRTKLRPKQVRIVEETDCFDAGVYLLDLDRDEIRYMVREQDFKARCVP